MDGKRWLFSEQTAALPAQLAPYFAVIYCSGPGLSMCSSQFDFSQSFSNTGYNRSKRSAFNT
jgi:hypothetical protein